MLLWEAATRLCAAEPFRSDTPDRFLLVPAGPMTFARGVGGPSAPKRAGERWPSPRKQTRGSPRTPFRLARASSAQTAARPRSDAGRWCDAVPRERARAAFLSAASAFQVGGFRCSL